MFYLALIKIRRQAKTTDGNINYRPCSTRNFEATGAAGDNLRLFSFSGSDQLLGQSTLSWDSICRESEKLTEFNRMAVNQLKDHTVGKKHSAKVR